MRGRILRTALKGLGFLALSLGLSFLLFHVASQPFQVQGASMSPTLAPGDYLLVDRVLFKNSEVRRGDLVVFRRMGGRAFFVKRVVALGGDLVEWRDGSLSVNGEPCTLPGGPRPESDGIYETWLVPPATAFCVGDNLGASHDSRSFGPVPLGDLYGRVVLCYLPPSRWQWLARPAGAGDCP